MSPETTPQREAPPSRSVEAIADDITRLIRIDLRQAEALAREARAHLGAPTPPAVRGRLLRATGHVHYARGRYRSALRCYRAARAAFAAAERSVDVAITTSGALHALAYVGEYDTAYTWAAEARRIFAAAGDRLRLARLDSNEANILYRQDRFAESLALDERAYRVFRRVGQPNDLSAVLRNMAVAQTALGQFERAIRTYTRARRHNQRHGMPLLVAECDYNIAYVHCLRGEYATATRLYDVARAHSVRIGDPYHQALCDMDVAEMSLDMNLLDEAVTRARLAVEQFRTLDQPYEHAKSLTFLGIALGRSGRADEAVARLKEARRLFAREQNREWPSLVDVHAATVQATRGRLDQAMRLLRRAHRHLQQSHLRDRAALCEVAMGRVALARGDATEAAAHAVRALEHLQGADVPGLAWQAESIRGLAARETNEAALASTHLLAARTHLQRLRLHLHGDDSRIAFLGDKHVVLDTLAALALNDGQPNGPARAMAFVEESKSRSLAERIAFRASDATARRARVQAGREARWATEHAMVALADVQTTLGDDTTLLEYAVLDGRLTAFVVTRREVTAHDLGPATRILPVVQLLHFQLTRAAQMGPEPTPARARSMEATDAHLHALHEALIAPVCRRLRTPRLVVVPHGELHRVPFAALSDGVTSLGDVHDLSCAPSASVYHLVTSRPRAATDGALVMGIPDRRAPAIADEARRVADLLPGARRFIGRQATRAQLARHGPHARYIHIATHGWFRRDNPMFSAIRLGDGDLPVFACYDLDLSADLVTLSGCSTGASATNGADEIMGLTRGLLFAGARAVLLSLWDVHDAATALLMQAFYEALRNGADPPIALRHAVGVVRARHPHPAFWASFVLVGDVGRARPPSDVVFAHPHASRTTH